MEILRTERLTDERWVNLFVRVFRHNGHEGRWAFASRGDGKLRPADHFDAVVIVPILLGKGRTRPRLVMLREYRAPVGDYIYAFPAGLGEKGETIESVARRELKEETGLDLVEVKHVSPALCSSAGMTDETAVMVFVTARAAAGYKAAPEASEEFETLLLDHKQVVDLCNSGVRFDGKAWVAL
ncbi:MAG TPA: NUDIX hydrolase, partial [Gemmataceae bacterium]|nr:NUDIX hydrolase [Gemmataceae bacterium]